MENKQVSVNLGGMSTMLLTIAFFTAKVTGYIDWPWIWVFAPMWLPLVVFLGVLFAAGSIYVLSELLKKK